MAAISMTNPTLEEIDSLVSYFCFHTVSTILPVEMGVYKSDILQATSLINSDPLFRNSEILILGYDGGHGVIVGTSFKRGHPAYLFPATWACDQLKDEIEAGAWVKTGSLEGDLLDYFRQLNIRS